MRLTLAAALLTATAAAAWAQPASPTAHEAAATAAYQAGDLATALREFEAAYAETSRPELLYPIGKLLAAQGDCPRAIPHFERYPAPGPLTPPAGSGTLHRCSRSATITRPNARR